MGLLRERLEDSAPGLQVAQLALSRCFYLTSELVLIERRAPEAAMAVSRSIVETALVGSYLALEPEPEAADRMLKSLAVYARRLRERFLAGEPVGALELMPEMPLLSQAMAPELETVQKGLDLYSLCKRLDRHPPFSDGDLASLLYEESYAVLSNHVVHPTIYALSRHSVGDEFPCLPRWAHWDQHLGLGARMRRRAVRPSRLDARGARHIAIAATVSLVAALSRGMGEPSAVWDLGAQDIRGVDGYWWSGSPARMIAASELGRMADLPTHASLNVAGYMVRVIAAADAFQELADHEQLVCASELIDSVRDWQRKVSSLPLAGSGSRPRGGPQTLDLCTNGARSTSQGLLAALALVYAGQWPDNPHEVERRLNDFDQKIPHKLRVLNTLRQGGPGGFRSMMTRYTHRVKAMP